MVLELIVLLLRVWRLDRVCFRFRVEAFKV